jgi:hypothetical protein
MHRKASFIALMAMLSFASISALGQTGDKAKVKGMINSRTGETFIVKTAQGNVTVVLTDNTKTKDNKGLLGARNEKLAREALIPGLKVDVEGAFDNRGQVLATGITVDGDDLETSQMIQAGLTPTAKQVASNMDRIDALERRLAAVEGAAAAGASTPASASTQASPHVPAPAPAQAATPPTAAASTLASEPASAPPDVPTTSLNLLRVGLILLLLAIAQLATLHFPRTEKHPRAG